MNPSPTIDQLARFAAAYMSARARVPGVSYTPENVATVKQIFAIDPAIERRWRGIHAQVQEDLAKVPAPTEDGAA